jgi:hydrocephalus-inducing protein
MQIICYRFFPTETKSYKSEAVLKYDNLEAYIPIIGKAHVGNVYLSKGFI